MTEKRLRELFEVWKGRLGLDRWLIQLEVGGMEEANAYMETIRSTDYERGRIHVQPWLLGKGEAPEDVMIRGSMLTDDFVEASLVHELLHLVTRNMRAVVREDLDGFLHRDVYEQVENAMSRAEEQCVDSLAQSLVRAFNGDSE